MTMQQTESPSQWRNPSPAITDYFVPATHVRGAQQKLAEWIRVPGTQLCFYRDRIAELRDYAKLEGLAINGESENDCWALLKSEASLRPADLVLLDTGNLRAIWDDDRGQHIGLQFRGQGVIQYVIFGCDTNGRFIRTAGRDAWEGVARAVEDFGVASILYAR